MCLPSFPERNWSLCRSYAHEAVSMNYEGHVNDTYAMWRNVQLSIQWHRQRQEKAILTYDGQPRDIPVTYALTPWSSPPEVYSSECNIICWCWLLRGGGWALHCLRCMAVFAVRYTVTWGSEWCLCRGELFTVCSGRAVAGGCCCCCCWWTAAA